MHRLKYHLSVLLITLGGTALLAVAPVSALKDSPVTHANETSSVPASTDPATPHSSTVTDDSTTKSTSVGGGNRTDNTSGLHEEAQQLLVTKRQNIKQHTEAEKQKACIAHQKELKNRAANYTTAAQRHLDVFNSIFTKVQTYYTSKNLNVASYPALVANATTKQAAAQSAVDSLKALKVTIDCTATDPASSVATLKTAVSNARTALQDYRKAIKDIVVALGGTPASTPETPNTFTGGN